MSVLNYEKSNKPDRSGIFDNMIILDIMRYRSHIYRGISMKPITYGYNFDYEIKPRKYCLLFSIIGL